MSHSAAVPMRSTSLAIQILAAIGVLSVCLFALRFSGLFDSFEKTVKDDFGSPEAIAVLVSLYERAERELKPAAGQRGLKIPHEWIPAPFHKKWHTFFGQGGTSYTFASFDDTGKLIAIEFQGSRYGCFISREPERIPGHFGKAYRLATKPLYITGMVDADMH